MPLRLEAKSISKSYANRSIFRDYTIGLSESQSLCIKGPNGSGKSTMMRILAKVIKPSSGGVVYFDGQNEIDEDLIIHAIGFLSPHVEPYGELTLHENIRFVLRTDMAEDKIGEHLHYFGLFNHRNSPVSHLSTGLKQRLKYLLAVINEPKVLLFDEPGSNLDAPGKDLVYSYINSLKKDRIIIVATNVKEEERLCGEVLSLG